jgi:hypothetical protein
VRCWGLQCNCTCGSTTRCERQSEIKGSMPFSSLDRPPAGRQMASSGAWQRWIGLPEGASIGSRLNILTCLSETLRSFATYTTSFARLSASPRADSSCNGVYRRRTLPSLAGVRKIGRWSASCRSAITGQRRVHDQEARRGRMSPTDISAG